MMTTTPSIVASNYAHARTCAWCGDKPAVRFAREERPATAEEVAQLDRSGQARILVGATNLHRWRGEALVTSWVPTCGCNEAEVPEPPRPAPRRRWCAECGDEIEGTASERCEECRVDNTVTEAIRRTVVKMAKRGEATGEIAKVTGLGTTTVKRIRAAAGVSATARDGAIVAFVRRGNDGARPGSTTCKDCGHNIRVKKIAGVSVAFNADREDLRPHAKTCSGHHQRHDKRAAAERAIAERRRMERATKINKARGDVDRPTAAQRDDLLARTRSPV